MENCAVRGKLTVRGGTRISGGGEGGRSPRPGGSVQVVPNTAHFPTQFSHLIFRGKCAGKRINDFSSLDEPHRKEKRGSDRRPQGCPAASRGLCPTRLHLAQGGQPYFL